MTNQLPRVLFISPFMPDENGVGVRQRCATFLRALASRYRIDFVFIRSQESETPWTALTQTLSATRQKLNFTPNLAIQREPIIARHRRLSRAQHAIARWPNLPPSGDAKALDLFRPTVVMLFRMTAAEAYFSLGLNHLVSPKRVLLDMDDIESEAVKRRLALDSQKLGQQTSFLMWRQAGILRRAEERLLSLCDLSFVCSDVDVAKLQGRAAGAKVMAVPNSVALRDPTPLPTANAPRRILFVGTFTHYPNIDAMRWFTREIAPQIIAAFPEPLHFDIVGFGPSQEMRALSSPNLTIHGGVESVASYYSRADLVVVPIRVGGGTRIKILEAMAHARPVVSTTIGAEGIAVTPGADIRLADTADDFANECIRLLHDRAAAAVMANRGRALIESTYSRQIIEQRIVNIAETGQELRLPIVVREQTAFEYNQDA